MSNRKTVFSSPVASSMLPIDPLSAQVDNDGNIVEEDSSWSGYNVIDMDDYKVIVSLTEEVSSVMAVNNIIEKVEKETGKKVSSVTGLGEGFPIEKLSYNIEKSEAPKKEKRTPKPKNPFQELLPQVFNSRGNVKRHPRNDKAKSSQVRDIIRQAAKFSNMSSIMIVLPVGVLHLGREFYDLCYNSKGEPNLDLHLEEMLMQGWVLRGVNIDAETKEITQLSSVSE